MKFAGLAFLCLATLAPAQELVLTATGPTTVYEGQLIPVKLELRGTSLRIWGFGGFRLEPAPPCPNYSPSCQPMDMWTFHKFDSFLGFGHASLAVETDINSFIPALKPGKYRIRAVAAKQGLPKAEILSNAFAIQVIPATPGWLHRTIEESRRAPTPKQLGFLYVKEAFEAGLESYGKTGQRDFLYGLYRNPNEDQSCQMLRAALQDPANQITADFIWLIANVCRRAKFPFAAEMAAAKESDSRRLEWIRATTGYEQQTTLEAIHVLAARAGKEGPHAFAERAQVLRYVAARWMTGDEQIPDFAKPALAATVRDLPGYAPREAIAILSEFWYLLRTQQIRPAIDGILRRDPFDHQWIDVRRSALRLLLALDPAAGHAALLAELRDFRPTLDEGITRLLPAATVPPMDTELIGHLARMQRGEIQHPVADAFLLIALYLSPQSQERMKQVYESQTNPCQPEIVAYFLRVQPVYAEQLLKRATTGMHAVPGPCTVRYINAIPRLIMTPVLENYLVAHLQHENVYVKADAARMLSGFGTSTAKKPLWDSYLYFHEYWKGKDAELNNPDYRDGRFLEEMLRTSIVRGRAWFTSEAELRRLGAMCISERCKADSAEDFRIAAEKPIPIELAVNSLGIHARVAQSSWFESMDALQRKLAQFPAGSRFQIRPAGGAPRSEQDRAAAEIRRYAEARGLQVNSSSN